MAALCVLAMNTNDLEIAALTCGFSEADSLREFVLHFLDNAAVFASI